MTTKLLYLANPGAWQCETRLIAVHGLPEGTAIELAVSPFFPRGGGQPSDTGLVIGASGEMQVNNVSRDFEGGVPHCGRIITGQFAVGEPVRAMIDRDVRLRNSRLHTAGELICAATVELGRRWPVTAASHIPGQSRVAFATDLTPESAVSFVEDFKTQFHAIVARDEPVQIMNDVSADQARRLCPLDASSIEEKRGPLRLVSPVPGFFRPCTGAHLQRTGEVGEIVFRKFRLKSGELSISYDLGPSL